MYTLANGRIFFFLWLSNIPLCVYIFLCVYLLYPFICWWTLRIASISWLLWIALLWTSGYIYLFKFVFFSFFISFSFFFFFCYIYSRVELLDHLVVLVFSGVSILFFIVTVPIYIPTNCVEGSVFSTSSPMFAICDLFDYSHSDRCMILIFISVMISGIELFFMWLLAICNLVWKKCLLDLVKYFCLFLDIELYELFIYFE